MCCFNSIIIHIAFLFVNIAIIVIILLLYYNNLFYGTGQFCTEVYIPHLILHNLLHRNTSQHIFFRLQHYTLYLSLRQYIGLLQVHHIGFVVRKLRMLLDTQQ